MGGSLDKKGYPEEEMMPVFTKIVALLSTVLLMITAPWAVYSAAPVACLALAFNILSVGVFVMAAILAEEKLGTSYSPEEAGSYYLPYSNIALVLLVLALVSFIVSWAG